MTRVPAALFAVLTLAGCASQTTASGLPTVGDQPQLCADRVDAASARAVVAQNIAELRELTTFKPDQRAGECALLDADGGALLSVQVVSDPKGKALAAELKTLSEQDAYSGDDHSGVSGDGRSTTALFAVDSAYYVRVLGLGGTSAEQREAALGLAGEVARRTSGIK